MGKERRSKSNLSSSKERNRKKKISKRGEITPDGGLNMETKAHSKYRGRLQWSP